ncbi:CDP-diacylglycerol--serine O-phosphatidyltransferase [Methylobrevis pamukkalensis]|uniref:CDP-diacylglycerol--serine O-phosphatidyltransferase n=1 Tax=Methylobrevis pamukkalensis TaxID=1439726 RepID=A0A1E3H3C2_9HYPH|nr:CDP-diacylglycerol--serine O-phosphatidyltransferase [Methylobrevis pamukkalensis]ODN70818.1 Bifunctional IPC transferase and DIPP synthase [Methylobrevis pamukkalensis]
MSSIFPPFDPFDRPKEATRRPRRIGRLPVRMIVPNMVTLLALCVGLTSIRFSMEGRFDMALGAIVLAGLLDALDGRIARFLKATSRFGAELDSLADFMSFGCAPALLLYSWSLHDVKSIGWIAALLFAIAAALRLARFNVMLLSDNKPAWQGNFFVGVPAPAGAICVLLPVALAQIDTIFTPPEIAAPFIAAYTVLVGVLMVSRVPTFSGKKLGGIRRDLVVPLFVVFVLVAGLTVNFPFEMLALVTILYLLLLPVGWRAWNRLARKHGAQDEEVTLDMSREAPVGDADLDDNGNDVDVEPPARDRP